MEALIQPHDSLICLSIQTTHDKSKFPQNYRRLYMDKTLTKMVIESQNKVFSEDDEDVEESELLDIQSAA
jgi:hypothetical protein